MCPFEGIPDCFNCTLRDCMAEDKEMLHQEHLITKRDRKRRLEKMEKEFLSGLTVSDLSDKYKITGSRICQLLKEQGVSVREVMNARKRRPA